jgi:hypothetical protein
MSWDVTVQRFSREYEVIEDIPETERGVPLGSRVEVQAVFRGTLRQRTGQIRRGACSTHPTVPFSSIWERTIRTRDS